MSNPSMTAEHQRLAAADSGQADWRLWGPYLSERQWGTVREDYSEKGDAWNHFPHDALKFIQNFPRDLDLDDVQQPGRDHVG